MLVEKKRYCQTRGDSAICPGSLFLLSTSTKSAITMSLTTTWLIFSLDVESFGFTITKLVYICVVLTAV